MVKLFLAILLTPLFALAGYSPSSNIYDSSGNSLSSTSGALNSYLTNSSLAVTGTFWQATQPVSGALGKTWDLTSGADSVTSFQGGTWSTGRTWTLLNTTDSVNVGNFPSTYPVTGTFWQATQPVSAASLPLPTGAATSAKQPALGTAGTASTDVITVQGIASMTPLKTDGSGVTQPISAASLPLPTGAATAANQTSQITQETTTATNTGNIPAKGAATTANSMPVNIASDQTVPVTLADMLVTGQAAQTATVNNILTATSGTAATNLMGYKSALVQVTSTGTAGTFIFEGSNDNVNFQTIPVYNQAVLTGTPITAAITASASQIGYVFPIQWQYVRLRIASTITGGSIQAFSRFTQETWAPNVFQVAQATAGNLNVNVGTLPTLANVTTLATLTNGNLGFPGIIADVAFLRQHEGKCARLGGIKAVAGDGGPGLFDDLLPRGARQDPLGAPEVGWQLGPRSGRIEAVRRA